MNKYYRPEPTNENKAKTIINRLGQKSISLPRIDEKKKLRGYPSLSGTASEISKFIPPCKLYVEPFAGTAKVYQELLKKGFKTDTVLNDKSQFIFKWLKDELLTAFITNQDFIQCIKRWDGQNTVLLIDAPWNRGIYDHGFSCFDRSKVAEYDNEILELCENLESKFIICSDKNNIRMLNSGWNNRLIEGEYKICNAHVKTLLTSNMELNL